MDQHPCVQKFKSSKVHNLLLNILGTFHWKRKLFERKISSFKGAHVEYMK